ncbi:N-acetyltransferase family protein [Algoriphagus halophilus]|uniref:GNAT family N-acetyltransferase n=1 Tax=Algoriphagus halophilus TaxID=226505 RepID=UPI00358F370A
MSDENKTKVRFALEKDLQAILEINNHEIEHSTVNYDYEPKTLEFQNHWFQEKAKAGFPILVAERENQIIGFATYGTFRPKPGYQFTVEHSVYIHSQFRGKGIGYSLMKELITHAKGKGFHLMVGGIDASNLNSLYFHKKLGFQEVGRFKEVGWKFNQWLDLIFVQRIL